MSTLEIFIITYNRYDYLKETITALKNSVFNQNKITVLNNCSTDDTFSLFDEFKNDFNKILFVNHPNNIGALANVIRAFELSNSAYTWVLCDDDYYNFDVVDDIFRIMEEGKIDLIHVGGHPEEPWMHAQKINNPANLLNEGYHYFKLASFLPCNIYKTIKLQKTLIQSYNNIINGYPHFPYIISLYKDKSNIYISKQKLVTARLSNQFYDHAQWFVWWINSCKLLTNKTDVKIAFLDHFESQITSAELKFHISNLASKGHNERKYLLNFFNDYFDLREKLNLIICMYPFKGIRYVIFKYLKLLGFTRINYFRLLKQS